MSTCMLSGKADLSLSFYFCNNTPEYVRLQNVTHSRSYGISYDLVIGRITHSRFQEILIQYGLKPSAEPTGEHGHGHLNSSSKIPITR